MSHIETSRRERKKDETRERITRAALELFAEKGFEATTVDEICTRADVAKGTFFNYFPRKEAVLGAVMDRQLEFLETRVDALLAAPGRVRDKLIAMVTEAAEAYRHQPELHRHMMIEMLKGPVSVLAEKNAQGQGFVRRLIEAGQASGEIRTDVDPERLTWMFRGTFFITMLNHVFDPGAFEPPAEVAARMAVLFDGLAPREGR